MCVATMTGFPIRRQRFTILALNDRQLFHRTFDPEIASRDHDDVGRGDHLVDLAHRGLIFDLGDDLGAALGFLQNPPQFLEGRFSSGQN